MPDWRRARYSRENDAYVSDVQAPTSEVQGGTEPGHWVIDGGGQRGTAPYFQVMSPGVAIGMALDIDGGLSLNVMSDGGVYPSFSWGRNLSRQESLALLSWLSRHFGQGKGGD